MGLVLTGLLSDNIEQDLQPHLELPNVPDEMLLEKLNTSCACENERLDKRRRVTPQRPATIHSAQTSDNYAEKEKVNVQQNNSKVQPEILAELKEMRSNMNLLNDQKTEFSLIKEFMQRPQCFTITLPRSARGGTKQCFSANNIPTKNATTRSRVYARLWSTKQSDSVQPYTQHSALILADCRMRGTRQFRGAPVYGLGSLQRDRE